MISFFLTWFGVMFAMVFSPGPANIILAAAGAKQGIKRSIPLIVGIDSIFIIKSCLIGFGLAEIFQRYPLILVIVQWAGIIYLIWLALKFLRIEDSENSDVNATLGFVEGAVLQTLNAKGWLLVALMFSLFSEPAFELWGTNSTAILIAMLAGLNITIHTTWVTIGASLGYLSKNRQFENRMNRGFALALLLTAVWLGWQGIEMTTN
ncbi:LysE family translocator [Arenicella sp. 4NH20-0111]|uniref:LysE family translocator n=1 Tax=Arenicella sp. 4NH20-0111 TaxID=3127648 RepID=UPI003102C8A0